MQVGQCGNQIGCRFWEMALNEHAAYNAKARYDEALSSFFQNVDARRDPPVNVPVGDPIRALKARAVVVDMEEGVTNELLTGPMRDVFDSKQFITGQSGSGNNWACGSHHYGPMYRESLLEQVRRPVEEADSLQSFMLLHSLGGGHRERARVVPPRRARGRVPGRVPVQRVRVSLGRRRRRDVAV